MSNVRVICPFEDCSHHSKPEYTELDNFRRHLAQDHDRNDLFQLAYKKGIIDDPIRFHNHSYVIQKIAEFSIVNGDAIC